MKRNQYLNALVAGSVLLLMSFTVSVNADRAGNGTGAPAKVPNETFTYVCEAKLHG